MASAPTATRPLRKAVLPVAGVRPWGLVVGRNPFVVQGKLSAQTGHGRDDYNTGLKNGLAAYADRGKAYEAKGDRSRAMMRAIAGAKR